jgi:hypothetical protein
MDRISLILHKQRLLYYPEGTQLHGIIFEKNLNHQDPETVCKTL